MADAAAEYARTMSAALEGLTARLDALAALAGRPGDITATDLRDDSDDIAADLGEVLTAAEVFADVLADGAR